MNKTTISSTYSSELPQASQAKEVKEEQQVRDQQANELNIHQLAVLSQQGDKAKHIELLKALVPVLRSVVYKHWWGDNHSHEDIIQDILLVVHSKLHTYDPSMPILPWIHSIARYRVLDYVRSFSRKQTFVESIEKENVTLEFADPNMSLDKVENENLVAKALATLPERQSRVVYLLKVRGLSIEETAEEMEMSLSAVKVMAHRGYKKLAVFVSKQIG